MKYDYLHVSGGLDGFAVVGATVLGVKVLGELEGLYVVGPGGGKS